MSNTRIKELIGNLSIQDITLMYEDLTGKNHTLQLVKEILHKYEQSKKVCASCGTPIDPFSDQKMVVTFGPAGFERRGHFCAYDCMQHFMQRFQKHQDQKEVK